MERMRLFLFVGGPKDGQRELLTREPDAYKLFSLGCETKHCVHSYKSARPALSGDRPIMVYHRPSMTVLRASREGAV